MLEISQQDFEKLTGFIKTNYGLDLSQKKVLVESRLSNYIMDSGFSSFEEYLPTLYNDYMGAEIENLINKLTTNYTYFMRETNHFEHLMHVFLPYAENHLKDHNICVWSAGCSFGNEPYNLEMCLDEYFGMKKYVWDLKILATDISYNALRAAKNGIYTEESMARVPARWREKYFKPYGKGLYQVKDDIRNRIEFRYHNLMDAIKFKRTFDLIVCRNVMIYFDEQTKSDLCKRFYKATNNGGYLYIGHAESAPEDIPYKKQEPAIYRKEEAV